MLGLSEYTIAKAELWQLILRTQEDLTSNLEGKLTKTQAIRAAEEAANLYYNEYQKVLKQGLAQVASNAINEYQQQVGVTLDDADEVVKNLVDANFGQKYFNESLKKRLEVNKTSMLNRIEKAAVWGSEYAGLKRFFAEPTPYGSQYNRDNRVLLAQSAKIEQDAARYMADYAGAELIKWSLSHLHPKPDICDDLALAVDPEVVRYAEENKLDLDPRGVYFVKDLPYPPHPNCMCEYSIVTGEGKSKRARRKTSKALSNALKALRKK